MNKVTIDKIVSFFVYFSIINITFFLLKDCPLPEFFVLLTIISIALAIVHPFNITKKS